MNAGVIEPLGREPGRLSTAPPPTAPPPPAHRPTTHPSSTPQPPAVAWRGIGQLRGQESRETGRRTRLHGGASRCLETRAAFSSAPVSSAPAGSAPTLKVAAATAAIGAGGAAVGGAANVAPTIPLALPAPRTRRLHLQHIDRLNGQDRSHWPRTWLLKLGAGEHSCRARVPR